MRNAPRLKNSSDPYLKLIRIRKDMTPMEREEDLKLKGKERRMNRRSRGTTKPSGYGEEEKH